jgi:hypothetical protein
VVTARGPGGETRTFRAERFIHAKGFDVESNRPLPLASRDVHSIAPNELENSGLLSNDHTAPVWVIGSGKTAMDTIVALVRANPARRIGDASTDRAGVAIAPQYPRGWKAPEHPSTAGLRRDRLLRGAGPGGRGQDVRRGPRTGLHRRPLGRKSL